MPDFSTHQSETFMERGARILREAREELHEKAITEHRMEHPVCPRCGTECRRFTGRHSGKVFISHPFGNVLNRCALSDKIVEEKNFA